MTQVTDAEREAVETIYLQHIDSIRAFARKAANGNTAEAEEIVSDVSVLLCRKVNQLRHPEATSSWLYKIVQRVASDRRRTENRRGAGKHDAIEAHDAAVNPEAQLYRQIDHPRLVTKLLSGLAPSERALIERRFSLGAFAGVEAPSRQVLADESGVHRFTHLEKERDAIESMRESLADVLSRHVVD